MELEEARRILGVDKQTDLLEIKKIYWRLALEYHPDKRPQDKKAEAKFKEISRAYKTLSQFLKEKELYPEKNDISADEKPYKDWWMEKFKEYI